MALLGLMGGTFDPVHFGHLRLATEALEAFGLDAVRWIPSGQPGHRDTPTTIALHRVEMVRLAITGEPRFTLDLAETRTSEPTFTINTLKRLRAELGNDRPLVMILGMDSFLSLPTWRSWTELFDLAHFAVGERPGFELSTQTMVSGLALEFARRSATPEAARGAAAGAIMSFPMTLLDISATELRARISRGASIRYLLPESVLAYIGAHRLYR
ncbi:MAG: nicotinate-nucleotide adenylyltransferase [Betaproteobacteria bacterium]|jgi:nicotinate-nucleotide adenylyltransferase|nr:nicotinate-nucleotide adenylyltransferase [Betaproteobacteria bacterium]